MIDIGINLFHKQFPHPEAVITAAQKSGIKAIILITSEEEDYHHNLSYCRNLNHHGVELATTIGLHPHRAADSLDWIKNETIQKNNLIKAIGECGLDFFRMIAPKETQIKAFATQISIAEDLGLPLYIHERGAHQETLSLLKNIKTEKIIHCFTGGPREAENYLASGCSFGISSWLADSRRNQELINSIKIIPINKIMLETDSPYLLPPEFYKKFSQKTNEPKFLNIVAKKLSEIKNLPLEEIIDITTENATKFFKLSPRPEFKP